MGYFGLSLNTSRLHGDPYINCFISAAIEVPAYLISWLSVHFLPRRHTCVTSMVLAGAALYSVQIAPAGKLRAAGQPFRLFINLKTLWGLLILRLQEPWSVPSTEQKNQSTTKVKLNGYFTLSWVCLPQNTLDTMFQLSFTIMALRTCSLTKTLG